MRRPALALLALAVAPAAHASADRTPPHVSDLRVEADGPRFAGDRRLLTTISPNGDGLRDIAFVSFRIDEPAVVRFVVARTGRRAVPVSTTIRRLGRGRHTLVWSPKPSLGPRTYLVRLTVSDRVGNRSVYGAASAEEKQRTPVVRVLGIDAGFIEASYAPGQLARLRVETDAPSLVLRLHRSGPGATTSADNVMYGMPAGEPIALAWARKRHRASVVRLRVPALESGVYYAELTAPDGHVGYAPFVIRPPLPGPSRVAVVLPTNTWQAYNFRDEDGDGWGDTWYAALPDAPVRLGRAFLRRGVPPHFSKYDLGFLRWLARTRTAVDYLADPDLELLSGAALAARYDLVVFPGHHEYVNERVFDAVTRYRDLGGNLAFLSANNFFWRVRRDGRALHRSGLYRNLGKPEAALIGVQYLANDDGGRQAPYVVANARAAPWLWEGTSLWEGATLGEQVGGYGIEIDARTIDSPPGTLVLAEIPDLYGVGVSAEMTYYETRAGARVFAAGTLDFGGSAAGWPTRRIIANLWARLAAP